MNPHTKRVYRDMFFVTLSILFAVFLELSGIADALVHTLGSFGFLGVFFAGLFFTSVFTTATAIVVLAHLGETMPLPLLALLGGLGAVCGDYILFKFIKDTIYEDVTYLLSFVKEKRLFTIFKTRLFRFFVPLIGAFIIASPFPDEIGITMLGFSSVNSKAFLVISFVMNAIGILIIGSVGRAVIG